MKEKEMYMQNLEHEYKITLKVLKAYPPDKLDFKPHTISRTARELFWTFAAEATIPIKALEGKLMLDKTPQAPNTVEELIVAYENSYKVLIERIKNTSEEDLNKTVKFPVAPKKMGDVRCIDLAWMMLLDMVHHRGQFSIYLRMAGGKVPSIYGPSADEPWM